MIKFPATYTVDALHPRKADTERHVVTVKEAYGRPGYVFLTSPELGCSRDYKLPENSACFDPLDPPIHWFLSEHALRPCFITRTA